MLNNVTEIIKEEEVGNRSIFECIIRTLLYFDIFHYPLKEEEILSFLGRRASSREISEALDKLLKKGYIFQFNEFISVQNNRDNVVRRIKGNEMATKCLPLATRKARLIASFPFVKAVMASGSLSKGYMDEESDLDFFIITDPGRLWIARMLLVLYKRLFLKNSHKHFCINYFLSSDRLEIEEKNQFTATELATVMPIYNQPIYSALMASNGWLTRFYPNFTPRPTSRPEEKKSATKTMFEKWINILGGNRIDRWCMQLTYRRWQKVYKQHYSPEDFRVAFKTKKHASKNHPRNYQRKVTELLEQKWNAYSDHYNLHVI